MKKWISLHYHEVSIVILTVAFFAALAIWLGVGIGKVLVLLPLLMFLIFTALFLQFYSSYLTSSSKSYEKSYEYVHEAVHTLRNAYYYLELCKSQKLEYEEKTFREYMISTLTAASVAFSMITGKPCRTCIKVILRCSDDSDDLCLKTLVRDRKSSETYGYVDENEDTVSNLSKVSDHPVASIMSGDENYYMSNNLYDSEDRDKIAGKGQCKKEHGLKGDWDLPYCSILLSPIRYSQHRDEYYTLHLFKSEPPKLPICCGFFDMDSKFKKVFTNSKVQMGVTYCGFFGVDSKYTDVFTDSEAHQMAATIADAMVPVLSTYNTIINPQNSTKVL